MSSSAQHRGIQIDICREFPAVFLVHYQETNTYLLDMNNELGRQRVEISEADALKFSELFKIKIKSKWENNRTQNGKSAHQVRTATEPEKKTP